MKKFLLLLCFAFGTMVANAVPTITIDGDKSDWADVPMLSQPGTWPMLKVLPAADAELGTNALVYMVENTEDFDNTWAKYPTEIIDKDYNAATKIAELDVWQYSAMGAEYKATTGVNPGTGWISFPKGISANKKVIEIGLPSSYVTDLGSKFGFAMYYNSGAWYCPDYDASAHPEIKDKNGFLYKTRSYTTLPGTLTIDNAFAHPTMGECVDYVDFGMRDNGNDTARWAAFPVKLVQPAMYDVTANVSSTNGWKFEFWLVDMATNAIVAHLDPPASNISESKSSHTFGTLDLTSVPTGNYMLNVKNRTPHSTVKLNSIDLTYSGGARVALPNTVSVNDAWFSSNGTRANGVITYSSIGSGCWAKWNVSVPKTGKYDVTVNIQNEYGHNFLVEFFEAGNATPIASISEGGTKYGHDLTLYPVHLGEVNLSAGNYEMKVSNSIGDARFVSVKVAYAGGAVVNAPGYLAGEDAALEAVKMYHDDKGYIHYKDNGTPLGEYAYWKIHTTSAYSGKVILDIPTENAGKGHEFHVELYSALDGDKLSEAYEESVSYAHGLIELGQTFEFSAETNYFIKLINHTKWSSALLRGISLASSTITLDEDETNVATVIGANNGNIVNAELKRSFKGGMFNTICLPFAVPATQVVRVFGEGNVQKMISAEVDDYILNLNFESVSEMEAGKPYLVRPAADFSNPKFVGVKIVSEPVNVDGGDASFVGNFVVDYIDADPNNLFLGADDMLYFPTAEVTIKGLRAYFAIDAAAPAPTRARIVSKDSEVTAIDLIHDDQPAHSNSTVQKVIMDGHLILVKDGVQYSVMGVRVK